MAQIDPKLQKRLSAAITEFADRLRNLGLAAGDAALAVQDMAIELDKDGRKATECAAASAIEKARR